VKSLWGIHDFILPSPWQILQAAVREHALLQQAALTTLLGAGSGFLAALIVGSSVSLAMALSRPLRYGLYPLILFMQMAPILATAAIIVILFDVGLSSVAAIAFIIGVFPVIANTLHGLCSIPGPQLELFRLYKASRLQELFLLRVPYALPSCFVGARIAATLAVIGSITGEIFAGSSHGGGGLGFLILTFKAELKIDALYATALLSCLLGFAFVAVVELSRRALLREVH
jgi:NitT/TauT family transport system permease protein